MDHQQKKISQLPLPPQNLIFMDKSAEIGVQTGVGLCNQLIHLGLDLDLETSQNVMEIGCGWGRIAYGLNEKGYDGYYYGMDILKNRIDWLQNNFTPNKPNFEFIHPVLSIPSVFYQKKKMLEIYLDWIPGIHLTSDAVDRRMFLQLFLKSAKYSIPNTKNSSQILI